MTAVLPVQIVFIFFCFVGGFASGFLLFGSRGRGCRVEVAAQKVAVDEPVIAEVSGAVTNPGVYKVEVGARVGDLINQSGGFDQFASKLWITKKLNLADKLNDSQKIYIPYEWEEEIPVCAALQSEESAQYLAEEAVSDSTEIQDVTQDSKLINVNSATQEELDSLPGIGPAYAEKIIANRPYSDFQAFTERSQIPQSTAKKVQALITF